jgi:hypothetical protein
MESESNRTCDFQDRRKAGVAIFAERLVEALSAQSCIAGHILGRTMVRDWKPMACTSLSSSPFVLEYKDRRGLYRAGRQHDVARGFDPADCILPLELYASDGIVLDGQAINAGASQQARKYEVDNLVDCRVAASDPSDALSRLLLV